MKIFLTFIFVAAIATLGVMNGNVQAADEQKAEAAVVAEAEVAEAAAEAEVAIADTEAAVVAEAEVAAADAADAADAVAASTEEPTMLLMLLRKSPQKQSILQSTLQSTQNQNSTITRLSNLSNSIVISKMSQSRGVLFATVNLPKA